MFIIQLKNTKTLLKINRIVIINFITESNNEFQKFQSKSLKRRDTWKAFNKYGDNMKINLKDAGSEVLKWTFLLKVNSFNGELLQNDNALSVPQKAGELLTIWATVTFPVLTLGLVIVSVIQKIFIFPDNKQNK